MPVEALHEREILTLGIADGNIIGRHEDDIGNLALGGEGLAAARRTEDQAVRVALSRTIICAGKS